MYWNFLEMEFDPPKVDPAFGLSIHNLVDEPIAEPRGGCFVTDYCIPDRPSAHQPASRTEIGSEY